MADEQIREGEPDPRRERDTTHPYGDDANSPDIRKHSKEFEFVRQYHKQIVALGVLWILLFGVLPGLAALWFTLKFGLQGIRATGNYVFGAYALVWTALGVLACLKHLWAVYFGLVINYLTALWMIFEGVSLISTWPVSGLAWVCPSLFLALSILQAHRVVGLARKMRSAGIPLDREPE
jgi:hypothetical protein